MRLPRLRMTKVRAVLAACGFLAMIWYVWQEVYDSGPHVYDSIRHADQVTLYEGLPHQNSEAKAFKNELKTKQTIQLSGFPFYPQPLVMKNGEVDTLRELLGDRSTYYPFSTARNAGHLVKACGGFHPDYAVEWLFKGQIYRGLICLGCSEVRFYDPAGQSFLYDFRSGGWFGPDRNAKLRNLFKGYRRNRPSIEMLGDVPHAVTTE